MQRITTQLPRAAAHLPTRLRVIEGADVTLEVAIPAAGVTLGADPDVEVTLRDEAVSARHCTVVPGQRGFEVTDLASRNGTFVDNVAIERAVVPLGAMLRLGETVVQLLPAEEPIEIPPSDATRFGDMEGRSLAMRRVYAVLERASVTDAPVLLLGESGTGKELAARGVHQHSSRRAGPFVVFDCGAATDTLIESDLFGHVRGAFTGAETDRPGAFALAHGGTLFLDEVGDLPLALQPKLLRLLETGEIAPLGTTRAHKYDVRIVAATHHDLWQDVSRGVFRGDLYYRLAVVEAHLPPLRLRVEDIAGLAQRFLERAGARDVDVGGRALDRLVAHHWPGNVRELRNVIGRAVALSRPGTPFDRMPFSIRGSASDPSRTPLARADRPFQEAKADIVSRFERDYLTDLRARWGDNLSAAARAAGLERKYLYRLLRKAGLLPPAGPK